MDLLRNCTELVRIYWDLVSMCMVGLFFATRFVYVFRLFSRGGKCLACRRCLLFCQWFGNGLHGFDFDFYRFIKDFNEFAQEFYELCMDLYGL